MAVKPLRIGDVLEMGEGRRAVIIGRAARPSERERERARLAAGGRPDFLPFRDPGPAGERWARTAYGWHIQWLDTGELGTLGEDRPNRLGERPHPVVGGYADTYAADMLL